MRFAIKIGNMYLKSVDVESGRKGHSKLSKNTPRELSLVKEPIYMSSLSIADKIRMAIDLMRFGDITPSNITIEAEKDDGDV